MKILDVKQGTPEWLAARACYFCASEAAAAQGRDPNMTRGELLRLKSLGTDKEFSGWEQKHLLARGHDVERLVRPLVEADMGEDLYPVTATDDEGRLLASFDGINMAETRGFECKQWNRDLAAAVEAGDLPPSHWPQVEQQILIAGLESVVFVVSDGTREKWVQLEYRSRPERREQLLAGWKQFEEDLKSYRHVEDQPKPNGKALMALPALSVQLVGEVTTSNLPAFRDAALAFIAGINTDLKTDQDFADAEATIKFCGEAEDRLALVKQQALEQTVSIAELFRTINQLGEAFRGKRLDLDKVVKARKETIREEIRRAGVDAFAEYITMLNTHLGRPYMPPIQVDFAGAMKGLKTLKSLRDAVDNALAKAKIEASATRDRIQVNMRALRVIAGELEFLFPDEATIVLKAKDDFEALVKNRVAEHKGAEEKRQEAERERIRLEEVAKLAAQAPAASRPTPQPGPVGATMRTPSDDGRDMLADFVQRYGDIKEFASIVAIIRAHFTNARKKKAVA